jgi:hypothetical protein
LLFTSLPLAAAATAFMAFHVLWRDCRRTCWREVGVPTIGAAASGIATSVGFFFGHNICASYSSVAAWLRWACSASSALRSTSWRGVAVDLCWTCRE